MGDVEIPDEAVELAATAIDKRLSPITGALSGNQALGSARMALEAGAPLILAAKLEALANGWEKNAHACRSFSAGDFSEGRAAGLELAVERARADAAKLRTPGASPTQDGDRDG
jgi:hypothetical protein